MSGVRSGEGVGPRDGVVAIREVVVAVATLWTSPDAPRPGVDDAAVADRPDPAAWGARLDAGTASRAAAGVSASRLGLHGRTLSQLLLGEPVAVLGERDGWSYVVGLWQDAAADPRGYPGWVRSGHLAAPVERRTGRSAVVRSLTSTLTREDGTSLPVSCATMLWVDERGPAPGAGTGSGPVVHPGGEDRVAVLLPGGTRGSLPRDAVLLGHKEVRPVVSPDVLLSTARTFLGQHYLWGGTSGWGVDCSGLVHLVARIHRRRVPRDAVDQAVGTGVRRVPLSEVRAGDLYFFARPGRAVFHVGFATAADDGSGERRMLHAPEGGGLVEEVAMTSGRRDLLVSAGRLASA